MSTRYRVIVFLIVLLVIILIGCSCMNIKEGYSDKCQEIYDNYGGDISGNEEWKSNNCEGFEGFSLLNPMKVINGEAQANETPTGLNLSEYNTFIIGENSRTASNTSCLNHDKEMKL